MSSKETGNNTPKMAQEKIMNNQLQANEQIFKLLTPDQIVTLVQSWVHAILDANPELNTMTPIRRYNSVRLIVWTDWAELFTNGNIEYNKRIIIALTNMEW